MSNTKKLTKKDNFNTLLNLAEVKSNPILVEFIKHELELLAKKNASDKKPTATQIANEKIKTQILETITNGSYTISEMQKLNPKLAEYSNQKLSALVKQMIDSDVLVKEEIKRKSYFRKA